MFGNGSLLLQKLQICGGWILRGWGGGDLFLISHHQHAWIIRDAIRIPARTRFLWAMTRRWVFWTGVKRALPVVRHGARGVSQVMVRGVTTVICQSEVEFKVPPISQLSQVNTLVCLRVIPHKHTHLLLLTQIKALDSLDL